MNNKKEKALYEKDPSKWVIYWKEAIWQPRFAKKKSFHHDGRGIVKLILKEHEKIADAVIANPDVKVECNCKTDTKGWFTDLEGVFFEDYQPNDYNYRLAKPQCGGNFNGCTCDVDCQCESHFNYKKSSNFNGGYIKASQNKSEKYDAIINAKVICGTSFNWDANYWYIKDNQLKHANIEYIQHCHFQQLFVNNGKLSWDETEELKPLDSDVNEILQDSIMELIGEEDGMVSSNNTNSNSLSNNTISITSDDGKVYEFEKPEFECELFAVRDRAIFGTVFNGHKLVATKEEVEGLYYEKS